MARGSDADGASPPTSEGSAPKGARTGTTGVSTNGGHCKLTFFGQSCFVGVTPVNLLLSPPKGGGAREEEAKKAPVAVALGYLMLAGAMLYKFPQIWRIRQATLMT